MISVPHFIQYLCPNWSDSRCVAKRVIVAQLSLASKEAANGYTPYHKINKLGMHIRKEMWLT